MSITRHCAQLLEAAARYHVTYGDRLANHLPMVLIALDKMGATQEQLQSAFDRSVPHLQLRPGSPVENIENIAECRNRDGLFASALHYYEQQLARLGIAGCLQQELSPLLPAIATAAFHGLIRTAYGVHAQHLEEVAMGLAYWNLEYHSLESSDTRVPGAAADILSRVAAAYPHIAFAPGNIADRMQAVTGQPDWISTPIQPQQLGLEDIARVAIKAYLGTRDFTLLHGVTGCHALRILLPFCSERETALRYFWQGLVIAYLTTNPGAPKPHVHATATLNTADWDTLMQRACDSDDDHVVKLVYSCAQEYSHYRDERYLQAAAAVLN